MICSPRPTATIKFRLYGVWKSATLSIMKKGENSYTPYMSVSASNSNSLGDTGEIDITNQLSAGENQIKVSNKVDKKKWYRQYERDVSLKIWAIGGVGGYYNQHSGCNACHSKDQAFYCKVNKFTGAISCQN
jgi:hypothetical protein